MNIFVLDLDPEKAAQAHCDCHVVKMITEAAQMLCTVSSGLGMTVPYKPTHQSHPCTVWAGESLENWLWLQALGKALHDEYKHRWPGREHKSGLVVEGLVPPPLPSKGLTRFALAMPEEYHSVDPVKAYRRYYREGKAHLLKYTNREAPWWTKRVPQEFLDRFRVVQVHGNTTGVGAHKPLSVFRVDEIVTTQGHYIDWPQRFGSEEAAWQAVWSCHR